MKTTDQVALDDWYAVATAGDLTAEPVRTKLLGQDIEMRLGAGGQPLVREIDPGGQPGPALPVQVKYGCLFTTLGTPEKDIVHIEEALEADRRFVLCGWVTMRASGLRVVENFLDMAHFPFVHTDILGSEPHTEVPHYLSEIRRDVDEVWATNCTFFQPRIAATESEGDFVQLT
jgi:phenylpropionate dioxygenase-like ring-hydroxylating dioxygenase large terminal subunit